MIAQRNDARMISEYGQMHISSVKLPTAGHLLIFAFVTASLSLSGIPQLSQVNDLCAGFLCVYAFSLVVQRRRLVQLWIAIPTLFLFVGFMFAIVNSQSGLSAYISILPIWMGAMSVAILTKDRAAENTVLAGLLFSAAANSLAAIVGFDSFATYNPLADQVSERDLQNRAAGLVGNANVFAVQATLALLALIVLRPRAKTSLLMGVWCLALHATLVSGSRKGLGLLLMLTAFILISRYLSNRTTPLRLLASCTTVFLLFILFFNIDDVAFLAPIESLYSINRVILALSGEDSSFSERQFLMNEAMAVFLERPIFGYGLDSFRHLSALGLYAHNNFLEIAVSGGIILFFIYYAIYCISFVRLAKSHQSKGMSARVWLFAVSIIFFDQWSVTYNLAILPILLMLVAARDSRSA